MENESGRLLPELFFKKKALHEVEVSYRHLNANVF